MADMPEEKFKEIGALEVDEDPDVTSVSISS